ncbi:MAG: hypothetical protein J6O49_03735, partial [Bacteroidaceae bacterium]|nr:hypothetical protein [Bacteroidaceae bacterium]
IDFVKINDGVNISPDYAKKVLAWLEKQGEIDNCPLEGSADCVTTDSRKQGKQTFLDKPELKFHEGDWVVNKLGVAWYIDSFDKKNYQVIGRKGNYNYFPIAKQDEMRHWTLADAKDGDVLQLGVVIAIFQEYIGNGNCKCYCSVCNGEFEIPSQDGADNSYGCHNAIPATKEQSDALMKAMADAGYTFDFEKKELKKLKFRVGDEVITENEESLTITRIDEKGYWSNDLFICDFASECVWDLVEQKPIDEINGEDYGIIEQSKKLAEILPIESADMYYRDWKRATKDIRIAHVGTAHKKDLPCWSYAALHDVLPSNKNVITTVSRGGWQMEPTDYLPNVWWCEYEDNESCTIFSTQANNPIDACYEMIIKLHKEGLL